MYLLLSRAFKNLGDFLIYDRAEKLIKKIKPNEKIVAGKGWLPLDSQFKRNQLEEMNAIIIPGGPCINPNLFPETYPLFPDISETNIPLIFLGAGSNYFPGTVGMAKTVILSESSIKLLRHTIDCGYNIGVRDVLTKIVLAHNGIEKVTVNGCPAWYDLEHLGKPLNKVKEINNILFTTPANHSNYHQFLKVIDELIKLFPKASITVAFHHGIGDNEVSSRATMNRALAKAVTYKGCQVIDASADLKKLKEYERYDIHVGYRVHGHIFFLSHRKPSFLIAEDSRGSGVLMTLGSPGIPAWSKYLEAVHDPNSTRKPSTVKRQYDLIYNKITRNWLPDIDLKFDLFNTNVNRDVPKEIGKIIYSEIQNGYKSFAKVPEIIDSTYKNCMKKLIDELP